MKLLVLKGPLASGKTDFAIKKIESEKDEKWVRISRDDLKKMKGSPLSEGQYMLINAWEDNCVIHSLVSGHNVILDSLNLNDDYNKKREEMLKGMFPAVEIEYQEFG